MKILGKLEEGPVTKDELLKLGPHEAVIDFLRIGSNPLHPRNKWRILVQQVEYNGVAYYHLVREIPLAVKEEWCRSGVPPRVEIFWGPPSGQAVRKAVDPRRIDWSKSDTFISAQTALTRERVGQLRRECKVWSQVNWNKSDREISRKIAIPLARALRQKSTTACSERRVRRWRAMRDWLRENQHHIFRRPLDFHKPGEIRSRLAAMDTSRMTLQEIARRVDRKPASVERILNEMNKTYVRPPRKPHRRRWHWERITESDWRKLTAKQISEIVTDDKGNHPSEAFVVNTWRRRGYRRRGIK
jgi:hypothetical protein